MKTTVFIIDQHSEKISIQQIEFYENDEDLFNQAWKSAIEKGEVDADNRHKYKFVIDL